MGFLSIQAYLTRSLSILSNTTTIQVHYGGWMNKKLIRSSDKVSVGQMHLWYSIIWRACRREPNKLDCHKKDQINISNMTILLCWRGIYWFCYFTNTLRALSGIRSKKWVLHYRQILKESQQNWISLWNKQTKKMSN